MLWYVPGRILLMLLELLVISSLILVKNTGYTNAYMAGDVDFRKSIYGYLMAFARGAVS